MVIDKNLENRARIISGKIRHGKFVAAVLTRDFRAQNNWCLIYSQELGAKLNLPIAVIAVENFALSKHSLQSQKKFAVEGLRDLAGELENFNIQFSLQNCQEVFEVINFAAAVVTDFSPLKENQQFYKNLAKNFSGQLIQVDAHNIVPAWIASAKQEFAAYTFRPKIQKLLPDFLTPYPKLRFQKNSFKIYPSGHFGKIVKTEFKSEQKISRTGGYKQGKILLKKFIDHKLANYAEARNDPSQDFQSSLSPYLNFGHISSQEVALQVSALPQNENTKSFLEELIVRKELSDNFCFYNSFYDSANGFPEWAKQTLLMHQYDPRDFVYSLEEFEAATTHDPMWNAAQLGLVHTGTIHGYMRMYWAKKILEWSKSPEEALKTAIYLNDSYQLDGRSPNGYVGCCWSIGGVHDRAWFERKIFGKIRFMNYAGLKRKFPIQKYIDKVHQQISNQTLFE